MKYIVVTLFVALSTAALAQEDQNQYKLNPDSLAIPDKKVRIRSHVNINDPLYILDDKEISHDELQKLDPKKIESITVLKDSASTAVYGKKGINGVIVISTKPRKKD
jgi:TonB-dependent SusC/RagA subfamily outer membrane receptor